MQTRLNASVQATPEGQEAERILRKCTHCGFCLSTCPTYQLSGDERDSPRGRIYLIKEALESGEATSITQTHLDRCLTCRNCETACPSGVEYGHLLDIGRVQMERQVSRAAGARFMRAMLRRVIPRQRLFGFLLVVARRFRPLLPGALAVKVPSPRKAQPWPAQHDHDRRVLLLEGCVQPAIDPGINPATARLFDRLGIAVDRTRNASCCGAVDQHLGDVQAAANHARRNIDAWWPAVEGGAEAIVVNASGCAVQVRDYAYLLRDDPEYAHKAAQISACTRDPVELLLQEEHRLRPADDAPRRIAFQAPCTLQHGLKLGGRVEALLRRLGFTLTPVPEAHLCCGSAGTYSLLQPTWAGQLRDRKLANLNRNRPELIATANIGCLAHLQTGTSLPVRHWIELVDVDSTAGS